MKHWRLRLYYTCSLFYAMVYHFIESFLMETSQPVTWGFYNCRISLKTCRKTQYIYWTQRNMGLKWPFCYGEGTVKQHKSLRPLPPPLPSPGCVPDSVGRTAFQSASRLFLWTAAFVLTKQIATQRLILSSDSYFEPSWDIFPSQCVPTEVHYREIWIHRSLWRRERILPAWSILLAQWKTQRHAPIMKV